MRKLILGFLFFGSFISAQGTGNESNHASKYIPRIAPPSPEAFKFGNFGNIPVGLFTGSPNVDIPLIMFNAENVSIPISLNYSSNGIKIDEMNGAVGLGWTLISAGVITRTVRGIADEKNMSAKKVPDIEQLGTGHPDVIDYLKDCQYSDGRLDSEPDLYAANFCGNSIKFIFDKNNEPVLYSKKNYIIERIVTGGNAFTFSITLDNGIKYYFSEKETIVNTIQGGDPSQQGQNVSAWYLSKITDNNGKNVVIEYNTSGYYTTLTRSQTMLYTPPGSIQWKLQDEETGSGYGTFCREVLYTIPTASGIGPIVSSDQHVYGKQIKRIFNTDDSNNILNEINFTYNSPYTASSTDFTSLKEVSQIYKGKLINGYTFDFDFTNNGRLFLKTITNKMDFSKYKFEYLNKNDLPERLSYSRDYWGFYNGKSNYLLVPQLFDQNDPYSVQYEGADQKFNMDTGYYGLLNRIGIG